MEFVKLTPARILLLLIWTLSATLVVKKFTKPIVIERDDAVRLLNKVILSVNDTAHINSLLQNYLDDYLRESGDWPKSEPLPQMEEFRREIVKETNAAWEAILSERRSMQRIHTDAWGSALDLAAEHMRSIRNDLMEWKRNDGFEFWRYQESRTLTKLIQNQLHHQQNPRSCVSTGKVQCILQPKCDFVCQLHHVTQCLLTAYSQQKMMILKYPLWRKVFSPLAQSCDNEQDEIPPIVDSSHSIMRRGKLDARHASPDIVSRINRLHDDPVIWFVAQFLKYLVKPNYKTQRIMEEVRLRLQFVKPIVGLHIRALTGAGGNRGFKKYMETVDEYFRQLELRQSPRRRRLYIDSNDPEVFRRLREEYGAQYHLIGDPHLLDRSEKKQVNALANIKFLSECDFLLCDRDTDVCRLAYAMMYQSHILDASARMMILNATSFQPLR